MALICNRTRVFRVLTIELSIDPSSSWNQSLMKSPQRGRGSDISSTLRLGCPVGGRHKATRLGSFLGKFHGTVLLPDVSRRDASRDGKHLG